MTMTVSSSLTSSNRSSRGGGRGDGFRDAVGGRPRKKVITIYSAIFQKNGNEMVIAGLITVYPAVFSNFGRVNGNDERSSSLCLTAVN